MIIISLYNFCQIIKITNNQQPVGVFIIYLGERKWIVSISEKHEK